MENIVICGNKVKSKTIKCDILSMDIPSMDIPSMDIPSMYYDISAKSNYNIEKPFIYLLRKLTDNNNIEILETRISSILNKYINQDN
jgi:GTP-binding nuclear protein Ran